MTNLSLPACWSELLQSEFNKQYWAELVQFVSHAYQQGTVYPPQDKMFAAFHNCRVNQVRVVIIGQDPYHGEGQANGLSFSVNRGQKIPPSLRNIYKELNTDLGIPIPSHGDLSAWSRQGVLLLNATLTVAAQQPGSHQKKGWELFTDAVIRQLSSRKSHIVYVLWGAYAQQKGDVINSQDNLIMCSPHPSPFAARRGFFGSRPFSQCNDYLQLHGKQPVDWRLEEDLTLFHPSP